MRLLICLLLILSPYTLLSQKTSIVEVKQTIDNIEVEYNLSGRMSSTYTVTLWYSIERGSPNTFKKANIVEGAVGIQKPEKITKKIVWNVIEELGILRENNVVFRVQAEVIKDDRIEKLTLPVIIGSTGAILFGTGFIIENKAKPKYDNYAKYKDPEDSFYIDSLKISRDDYYEEANSQHHKAIIFKVVGGAIILGGTAWLTKNIFKNRKIEKSSTAYQLSPSIQWYVNENNQWYPQFGLTLQF